MRIISGIFKGKKIKYLKNSTTRPLKDAVKENIFNVLEHSNKININIKKSYVLDLYSGIGSFGIECVSRGAEKVVFCEKDIFATKILKENLNNLSIINKSIIINKKIQDFLTEDLNEKFNIFFLDPPFASNDFIQNLNKIRKKKLFKTNHIIVIHRETGTLDKLNNLVNIINVKEYGRSKIIFGSFFF